MRERERENKLLLSSLVDGTSLAASDSPAYTQHNHDRHGAFSFRGLQTHGACAVHGACCAVSVCSLRSATRRHVLPLVTLTETW